MEKSVSKFDEKFIKNYDEDSNKGFIPEVHVEYPKDLQFAWQFTILIRKNENFKMQ